MKTLSTGAPTRAATALILAFGALTAAAAGAQALPNVHGRSGAGTITVACGDSTGLVNAIYTANSSGGAKIVLGANCGYQLLSVDNGVDGGNDLPTITSPISIVGSDTALIAGPQVRAFDVLSGGSLTITSLVVTGFVGAGSNGMGGGAILVHAGASVTVNSSYLYGNIGLNGGAILNLGTTTVNDSLIYNNLAPGNYVGGGISNGSGTLKVNRSTIIGNTAGSQGGQGGGVWAAGTTTIAGSIIAGNTAPVGADCGQALVGASYDLSGDSSCGLPATQVVGAGFVRTPANNGGGIYSMSLAGDIGLNKAVDAIPYNSPVCPAGSVDERGVKRHQDGNGISPTANCDIGALEESTPILTPSTTRSQIAGEPLPLTVAPTGVTAPISPTGTASFWTGGGDGSAPLTPSGKQATANIPASSVPAGINDVHYSYSGDGVYHTTVDSVETLFAQGTTGDAGYETTLPENKGSISATFVLPALGSKSRGLAYGAFVPYDSAAGTQPQQLTAGCIDDVMENAYECQAGGNGFLAARGDTIFVKIQENGGDLALLTITDQTIHLSRSGLDDTFSHLMLGAFLPGHTFTSDPTVTFSNAMVDGSPLGYDSPTALDTRDSSGHLLAVSPLSGASDPFEEDTFAI